MLSLSPASRYVANNLQVLVTVEAVIRDDGSKFAWSIVVDFVDFVDLAEALIRDPVCDSFF